MSFLRTFPDGIKWLLIAVFLAGCTISPTQAPPITSSPGQPATQPAIVSPAPTQRENAGQAGIGDPYYALLGNAGYDVSHYTIVLAIDPTTNAISGTTTIEAKATRPLKSFNLDFQGLTVAECMNGT